MPALSFVVIRRSLWTARRPLRVGIQDKERERQSRQHPQPWLHLARASCHHLAERCEHEAGGDPDADVVGEAHQRDHGECGDQFGVIVEIDLHDGREHQQPNND